MTDLLWSLVWLEIANEMQHIAVCWRWTMDMVEYLMHIAICISKDSSKLIFNGKIECGHWCDSKKKIVGDYGDDSKQTNWRRGFVEQSPSLIVCTEPHWNHTTAYSSCCGPSESETECVATQVHFPLNWMLAWVEIRKFIKYLGIDCLMCAACRCESNGSMILNSECKIHFIVPDLAHEYWTSEPANAYVIAMHTTAVRISMLPMHAHT